jgi:hypothetical protein
VQTLSPNTPATPTLTTTPAGSLAIGVGAGTTYRSQGGSWILRANVMVRNTGAEPVDVDIRQFHSGEMDVSGDDQSLPGHTSLIPNMTIQGDVAFYIGAGEPKPTTMALTFAVGEAPAVWHADVPLMFSPAPPAHGMSPAAPVYAIGVAVPSAVTWLQPDVGRVVQFNLAVTNTTSVALDIPRAYLVPALGNDNGSVWNDGSTLPDLLPIAAGGRVQGTVAFVFPTATAAPTSIPVTFGPSNNPQFNQTIAVTAVAPPTPPAS